jgi:mannose-6-phosphate isomerase-like protein (cupin superfamily)
MPELIERLTRIPVPGNKLIDEYVGCVNSKDAEVSVAHMRSPAGWSEPGQRPEFDEFTLVLKGVIRLEHESGTMEVGAGQAVIARRGEYVAVCRPAFTLEAARRDS